MHSLFREIFIHFLFNTDAFSRYTVPIQSDAYLQHKLLHGKISATRKFKYVEYRAATLIKAIGSGKA